MFGRMMNNYYYGKSGKGDFRKEDLPTTRSQLFKETLRVRLSGLVRLNLLYAIIWIPAMILVMIIVTNSIQGSSYRIDITETNDYAEYKSLKEQYNQEVTTTPEQYELDKALFKSLDMNYQDYLESLTSRQTSEAMNEAEFREYQEYWNNRLYNTPFAMQMLLLALFIAITGPFTAGVSYVTRNWARDEHAFIWSDFIDAVKKNWKIPLVISTITGLLPVASIEAWKFYGNAASANMLMIVPQILVPMLAAVWAISVTYMHPMTVTYDLKCGGVIKNGLILGVARLPFSIGIRLLHCVPVLICVLAQLLFGLDTVIALMILGAYYILIGFALSRFITASYTNAVFDRFINARIEGAKVNQGLQSNDDDADEDEDGMTDEDEESREEAGEREESTGNNPENGRE